MVKKKVVKRVRKSDDSGGWIIAGLLIGLGIGALYGEWVSGALIGLGAGFALSVLSKLIKS